MMLVPGPVGVVFVMLVVLAPGSVGVGDGGVGDVVGAWICRYWRW